MKKEVDTWNNGSHSKWDAPKDMRKRARQWDEHREKFGVAPWIQMPDGWEPGEHPRSAEDESQTFHELELMRSSLSLREWADDYCASNKHLKEFVYKKVSVIRIVSFI